MYNAPLPYITQEIFTIKIIMIREPIKIDKDQIAEKEGNHTEVEVSISKE